VCFVHADSRPPLELVRIMRTTLADTRTVLAGELGYELAASSIRKPLVSTSTHLMC
jgi:hypothetical protein